MYDFHIPYGTVSMYIPPAWSKELANIPTNKVNLIMPMTPVHRWHLPDAPDGMKLWIKRDDMTGSVLGGNKIRKLEFQFAEAVKRGCGSYLKCGSLQSNECRTIASVAAQLGLKAYFLIRPNSDTTHESVPSGNAHIMKLCGAKMIYFPKDSNFQEDIFPKRELIANAIVKKFGKPCFVDSRLLNSIAIHGYLGAWEELLQQGVIDEIDDVVVPTSSGVTLGGLAVGNYLTGSKVKIHGVATRENSQYFYQVIDELLEDVDLTGVDSRDIVDVIGGYQHNNAPGMLVKDIMHMTEQIAASTGVICEPTYGGKAIKALKREFTTNRHRFKGRRILYIHTGGLLSIFDRDLPVLQKDKQMEIKWKHAEDSLLNFL